MALTEVFFYTYEMASETEMTSRQDSFTHAFLRLKSKKDKFGDNE
jgi:hypothetical protein